MRSNPVIAALALVVSSGCVFIGPSDVSDDVRPWVGDIDRDGQVAEFVGYDPFAGNFTTTPPTFNGGLGALGYIDDGAVLVSVQLLMEPNHVQMFLGDEPDQVPVQDTFLRDEYGFGLSYIEQIPGADSRSDVEQPFRHVFNQGGASTATGTVFVEATDHVTFLSGRLEAEIEHDDGSTRRLDLDVEWGLPPD